MALTYTTKSMGQMMKEYLYPLVSSFPCWCIFDKGNGRLTGRPRGHRERKRRTQLPWDHRH